VNLPQFLTGVLPFGRKFQFFEATKRAVDSDADLRWGPDRRGFRRLLHPNGVCLTGKWQISEPTEYSGYFQAGSEGLLIARYSTCCTATQRGQTRSHWSGSCIRRLIPPMPSRCAPPASLRSRIWVAM
jgi:hypothetical protein